MLPGDVRGFVNRVSELRRLDQALAVESADPNAVAVSVIAGTAGVGKTALAIRWAHRVRDRFPDGQLYVNLRGYDPGAPVTADYALDHFLRALEVPAGQIPADPQAKAGLFRSLVADRRMLVILDNAATVGQVRPLLPGTASCLVLVTSRSRLRGLVVREGAHRVGVETLSDDESVTLLRTVTDGYRAEDDPGELAELARLCARLPLALRIAAERAASRPRMPLRDLIRDLRDESSLWDALSTEDDDEADAVRTVFAWSYRALPPEAAHMFRLLGLHPGTEFSVDAAAAVAGVAPGQARHLLDSLVGAHLVEDIGADRYQFHDLMRAYASDQAHHEEPPENQHVALRRVLEWYLHCASAVRAAASPGGYNTSLALDPPTTGVTPLVFPDRGHAVRWYEQERANLMAATRAAAASGLDRIAWQIPTVLMEINGDRDPLGGWSDVEWIGVEAARRVGDRDGEAVLHEGLGIKYRLGHRLSEAEEHYRLARELFEQIGDRAGVARARNGLGLTHQRADRLDEARAEFEQGLALARELRSPYLVATFLGNLGCVQQALGRLDEAERNLRDAVSSLRDLGEQLEESFRLVELADVVIESGQPAEAREILPRALAVARDHDNAIVEGNVFLVQAKLELAEGAPEDALASSQRAAVTMRQCGYRGMEARALAAAGAAYQQLERFDEAAAFYRRSAATHRELGDRWHLAVTLDRLAAVLTALDRPDEARDAWREVLLLLADLPGPRAAALREHVERTLPPA